MVFLLLHAPPGNRIYLREQKPFSHQDLIKDQVLSVAIESVFISCLIFF